MAGNVTQEDDAQAGGVTDDQCFDYNTLDELTAAWSSTDSCQADLGLAGASDATVGGPAPYWEAWSFNADGQRATQTDNAVPGSANPTTTTSYTYTAAGSSGAGQLASTSTGSGGTTTSYSYNPNGDTTSITTSPPGGGGTATSLAWTADGQLESTASSTAGDTSNIYDAAGGLLVAATPAATVLYLPNEQLSEDPSTQAVTATRFYPLTGGEAVRTGTATYDYTYQLDDAHGTPDVELAAKVFTPTFLYWDPYGNPRGSTVVPADGRSFLGDPQNPVTGLVNIGARVYNPATGTFLSPDPDLDTANPQALNSYSYANGNPNTYSDPTGEFSLGGLLNSIGNAFHRFLNYLSGLGKPSGGTARLTGDEGSPSEEHPAAAKELLGAQEDINSLLRSERVRVDLVDQEWLYDLSTGRRQKIIDELEADAYDATENQEFAAGQYAEAGEPAGSYFVQELAGDKTLATLTTQTTNPKAAAGSVPDPEPVYRSSGAPNRDSPWYVSYRDAQGNLQTVGNEDGLHAEARIQQMEPGAQMSRPFGWRSVDGVNGPQWVPGTVCRGCQAFSQSLFPDNVEGAPGGPWGADIVPDIP